MIDTTCAVGLDVRGGASGIRLVFGGPTGFVADFCQCESSQLQSVQHRSQCSSMERRLLQPSASSAADPAWAETLLCMFFLVYQLLLAFPFEDLMYVYRSAIPLQNNVVDVSAV